jgi:hypothetical protein
MARHFRSVPGPRPLSCRFIEWLSLIWWPILLLIATSSATVNFQTGGGGPSSYMGYPPLCAPGGVGRKPCGQGPPSMRPDGARVIKAADEGGCDDEDDNEEDDRTSTDRWVSGSGTPGSIGLAFWGPLGLWRLWFLCWGTTGSRCFFPWPIPDLGILSSADFGRCPKRSSGFRLAANPFAVDQWEHLRHLGDVSTQDVKVDPDDDRRPRMGHCLAHYQEGVEVNDFHDEEDGFCPYGASGFGSFQGVSLLYLPPSCRGRP